MYFCLVRGKNKGAEGWLPSNLIRLGAFGSAQLAEVEPGGVGSVRENKRTQPCQGSLHSTPDFGGKRRSFEEPCMLAILTRTHASKDILLKQGSTTLGTSTTGFLRLGGRSTEFPFQGQGELSGLVLQREVTIRELTFFCSLFLGEPSPKKGKRAPSWGTSRRCLHVLTTSHERWVKL